MTLINPAVLATGVPGDTKLSPHLQVWETVCPCGCGLYRVSVATLEIFEALRYVVNESRVAGGLEVTGLGINSGTRCLAHQHELIRKGYKGSSNSLHVPYDGEPWGHALDVAVPADMAEAWFFDIARKALESFPGAGLGIYPTQRFVHIDDGDRKIPARRWTA